jgi:hypothetical protein
MSGLLGTHKSIDEASFRDHSPIHPRIQEMGRDTACSGINPLYKNGKQGLSSNSGIMPIPGQLRN